MRKIPDVKAKQAQGRPMGNSGGLDRQTKRLRKQIKIALHRGLFDTCDMIVQQYNRSMFKLGRKHMANKANEDAAKKETAKAENDKQKKTQNKELSAHDRARLNDKARYDYGIMNADVMSEKQLKDEIAVIDKQKSDAEKQDKSK